MGESPRSIPSATIDPFRPGTTVKSDGTMKVDGSGSSSQTGVGSLNDMAQSWVVAAATLTGGAMVNTHLPNKLNSV